MVYNNQELIQEIQDLLLSLERELEYDNAAENYDGNTYAEDFYCELINMVKADFDLKNLNTVKKNHPAVDLGDESARVCIQITGTSSKKKIQDTFNKFEKYKLGDKYDKIYILVLKGKGGLMNISGLTPPSNVPFNKLTDIIDNQTIISWLRGGDLKIASLEAIRDLIKNYIRNQPELFASILLPTLKKVAEKKKFKATEIRILTIYQMPESILKDEEVSGMFFDHIRNYSKLVDYVVINSGLDVSVDDYKSTYGGFISLLTQAVDIELSRIILVPSKSNIDWNNVVQWMESGLRTEINSDETLSQFIRQCNLKKEYSALEKISRFKKYEEEYYSATGGRKDSKISLFGTSHVFLDKEIKVGICVPNPYIFAPTENSEKQLVIGSYQLIQLLSQVAEADLKVLVLGISPNELLEFSETKIKELIDEFDIVLARSNMETHYYSSFFRKTFFQSPKNDTKSLFTTGYLSINGFKETIRNVESFSETESQRLIENITELSLPTDIDLEYDLENENILSAINTRYITSIDKSLINYGTDSKAPCQLQELFVHPCLTSQPYEERIEEKIRAFYIDSLITDVDSYLLLGRKESGKSVLLKKILFEINKSYENLRRLPAFFQFQELNQKSCEEILVSIFSLRREKVEERLKKGDVVLLIDDISFEEHSIPSLRKLNEFKMNYSKVKIIASSIHSHKSYLYPDNYSEIETCNFVPVFIEDFKSKEIKELTSKWFKYKPEIIREEDQIDNIVRSFRTLGLPRTPMAISLYLWIIEKQERKPINNSSLLQNFIDNVLDKANLNQVYREKFDGTNKQNLLADLAYFMLKTGNNNYCIEYGKAISYIDDYLMRKRFNSEGHELFRPKVILDNLIDIGIFTEDGNHVKFRFACFFNYFLAIKMNNSLDFKEEVLLDENYSKYLEEIEIFTGINRDDEDILNIMHERMLKSFSEILEKFDSKKIAEDIDLLFKEKDSIVDAVDLQVVIESKPSSEKLVETDDRKLSSLPVKSEIENKSKAQNDAPFSFQLVKIVGNILRNSEEVDNPELKLTVYEDIVRCTALMACIEKIHMIRYFAENNKLPAFLPQDMGISTLLRFMPIFGQVNLFDSVGSMKMASTIFESITRNQSRYDISNIEKFFSVFNYIDIKSPKWKKILNGFTHNENIDYSSRDLAFIKVISYYYLRTKNKKEDEEFYLDQIVALKTKGKEVNREMRHRLTRKYRKSKAK